MCLNGYISCKKACLRAGTAATVPGSKTNPIHALPQRDYEDLLNLH